RRDRPPHLRGAAPAGPRRHRPAADPRGHHRPAGPLAGRRRDPAVAALPDRPERRQPRGLTSHGGMTEMHRRPIGFPAGPVTIFLSPVGLTWGLSIAHCAAPRQGPLFDDVPDPSANPI